MGFLGRFPARAPAVIQAAALNLGFAHQDCGTRSLVIKITRTAVQYHAWTAVQCARWIASPPALMDSLNGLSHHRLRLPSSAARADGHSACHRGVDRHAPYPGRSRTAITGLSVHELPSTQSTLSDQTACCRRARTACPHSPSDIPHGQRWGSPQMEAWRTQTTTCPWTASPWGADISAF